MGLLGPTRRRELESILTGMEQDLEEKDAVRELALKASRAVARLSVSAVGSLHRGKKVAPLLNEAQEEASRLGSLLKEHPDLYFSGFVENAHQDMTEAAVTYSLLRDIPLPRPDELGVTSRAYVLGLGDVVGEIRRHALDRLGKGDVEAARESLEAMEILYEGLMRFDFPRAVAAVKRKQDIARSLVEKTRGEVAVAVRTRALERKLDARSREE